MHYAGCTIYSVKADLLEALLDDKTRNSYLSQGIVVLAGAVDKTEAVEVLSRIEYLQNRRAGQEIKLLINSPGGQVKYSLAIYETMKNSDTNFATGCAGIAEGSAAMILAAGTKGRRGSLAHALIHVTDIWRPETKMQTPEQLEEIEKLRDRHIQIWVTCTGQNEETIKSWTTSQKSFTAQEALEVGILDFVVPESIKSGGKNGNIPGLFRS